MLRLSALRRQQQPRPRRDSELTTRSAGSGGAAPGSTAEQSEGQMPSMTYAMGRLAHAIAQGHRDRAELTTTRHKAVFAQLRDDRRSREAAARNYRVVAKATKAQRSKDTASQLALYRRSRLSRRRHRLELAAAQRSQLAAFMTGLTANVDALRVGFRAELDNARRAQRRQLTVFT